MEATFGVEVPMAGPVAESYPDAGHQGPDLGPVLFAIGSGRVGPGRLGRDRDRVVASGRVASPVAEFVEDGLTIVLGAGDPVLRRQHHPVLSKLVADPVSGFVETAHAAGLEQVLDPVVDC